MFRDKSIEIMIVFCIGIKVIFGRWTQWKSNKRLITFEAAVWAEPNI